MKSIVFVSRTGCLLPFLIAANLLFGWMLLKPLVWIVAEIVLIGLFIVNSVILAKKILSGDKPADKGVIDTKGEILKEGTATKKLS